MTTTRHTLPSGAWVEIGDAEELTEGQRRPVRMALMKTSPDFRSAYESLMTASQAADALPEGADQEGALRIVEECKRTLEAVVVENDLEALNELNDRLTCALIIAAGGFTTRDGEPLELPKPCTPEALLELRARDYDALQKLSSGAFDKFMAATDFRPSPDPASPTPPSSD